MVSVTRRISSLLTCGCSNAEPTLEAALELPRPLLVSVLFPNARALSLLFIFFWQRIKDADKFHSLQQLFAPPTADSNMD
jgi:hypothetical protein